ncbi:SDR family NAD(P)-dependent oxidoreductase [Streptomyces mirabilis]|uniref:SDR family NAD(P)-dependent oxidoreductase n=1 Tax=Streptomyces mirabilis TaxID=68239 RepID=UPI003692E2D9
MARYFAERGANVALLGRRRELVEKLVAEIGDNAVGLGADIADPDQVAAAVQATLDRFGRIDIDINTAGYIDTIPLTTADGKPIDPAGFVRLFTTNVVGTFNVMSQAAAAMLSNEPDAGGERGVIINTSSAAAEDGTVGMVGYSATKAALVRMTLPAAREFAGRGIRVNTIVAGGFDTPSAGDIIDEAAVAQHIQQFAGPSAWARPRNSLLSPPIWWRTATPTLPARAWTPVTAFRSSSESQRRMPSPPPSSLAAHPADSTVRVDSGRLWFRATLSNQSGR